MIQLFHCYHSGSLVLVDLVRAKIWLDPNHPNPEAHMPSQSVNVQGSVGKVPVP